jgi:hypothetical protein
MSYSFPVLFAGGPLPSICCENAKAAGQELKTGGMQLRNVP